MTTDNSEGKVAKKPRAAPVSITFEQTVTLGNTVKAMREKLHEQNLTIAEAKALVRAAVDFDFADNAFQSALDYAEIKLRKEKVKPPEKQKQLPFESALEILTKETDELRAQVDKLREDLLDVKQASAKVNQLHESFNKLSERVKNDVKSLAVSYNAAVKSSRTAVAVIAKELVAVLEQNGLKASERLKLVCDTLKYDSEKASINSAG